MEHIVWVICAIIYNGLSIAADLPCNKRAVQYGYVCVCDGSYCDTVERPPTLPSGQFHHYTTSSTSPGFTRSLGHFSEFSLDAEYVFTLNTSKVRQEIFGMGGAFTDSVGSLFNDLSTSAQDKFVESYFSVKGIEYSMGRVPIGASDFSPRDYILDDVPFDNDLKYFSLSYEDYNFKVPLIQKAMSVSARGLKLIGCSWRPPNWMKISNITTDAFLKQNYSSTWAKYHVKYLDEYKKEGVEFWGLSGGNEVMLGFLAPHFLPVLSTAVQQREFFKNHLKPQLISANYSNVKLIALDDQRMFALYIMDRFANDAESYEALDAIGLHWYFDRWMPPTVLDRVHERYPEKHILYTETSINPIFGPIVVELGGWDRAEMYANSIMETFNHWTQSYLDWNLMLNTDGGPSRLGLNIDSPVIINTTSGEFYKQPMFYAMGHFSKFIPPGSRVVQVTSDQPYTSSSQTHQVLTENTTAEKIFTDKLSNQVLSTEIPTTVQCTATANSDGSYSVFLLNLKNTTASVRVEDPEVGVISYSMEAHSLTTIVYWK